MPKLIDLAGQRFGRLTVVSRAENTLEGRARWLCKCICGNQTVATGKGLRNGCTKSCGCLIKDVNLSRATHGDSKRQKMKRLYRIWCAVKSRVSNKNQPQYKDYGGRGITICEDWASDYITFRDWSLKNGYNDTLTIDRIDNEKGYYPDNCRWVSMRTQQRNKSRNRDITFNNETKTLSEWAEALGMNYFTLHKRMQHGWSIEKAFTKPLKKRTNKKSDQ